MAIPIIVCADDYGLTPGISKAIRHLAETGRLSATSAMTVSPYWAAEGAALRACRGKTAVGLHFTLTDLGPISGTRSLAPNGRFPHLKALLERAFLRRLSAAEIERELNAQLDRFEAAMGSAPDFFDGHHHVHNLPVVRDVVLNVIARRLGPERIFLRYCDEPIGAIVRRGVAVPNAIVISLLARNFARRARAAGFAGNSGFRGVRVFSKTEDVRRLFEAALARPRPNMMIMCHPGTGEPAPDIADEISACRVQEYDFLRSDAWPALLSHANVELVLPLAGVRP